MKTKVSWAIFFLLTIVSSSFGQGNLQFNQVLNFGYGDNYSVPAGKVLKIESINFNSPKLYRPFVSCFSLGPNPGCTANGTVVCAYSEEAINYLVIDQYILKSSIFSGAAQITVCKSNTVQSCEICPPTSGLDVSPSTFNLPIWLREGKNVSVLATGIFISAIEFNIVP
jgi:hypothetical protein